MKINGLGIFAALVLVVTWAVAVFQGPPITLSQGQRSLTAKGKELESSNLTFKTEEIKSIEFRSVGDFEDPIGVLVQLTDGTRVNLQCGYWTGPCRNASRSTGRLPPDFEVKRWLIFDVPIEEP